MNYRLTAKIFVGPELPVYSQTYGFDSAGSQLLGAGLLPGLVRLIDLRKTFRQSFNRNLCSDTL